MAKAVVLLILFLIIKNIFAYIRNGMNLNPELLKTGDNIWAGNDYIDYNPDQNYGIVMVEAPLDV